MNKLGLASTAAVRQYFRLAQSQGLNPLGLLAQVGLPETVWLEDSGHISGEDFQRLLLKLLEQYPSPILGLLSGDFVQPGSYSVLGYITMSCATLGEAIAKIAPFEKLVGDMGTTQVLAEKDEIIVQWQCNYPHEQVRPQMVDNVFSSWIGYARWLGGEVKASPLRVELQRPMPEDNALPEYEKRWDCPVLFNQPHNRIVINQALLAIPLRQPDPELRQTLELHAHTKLATLQTDSVFLQQVRDGIASLLLEGITGVPALAEKLHTSTRTLQRKLKQEGAVYQNLLAQARQLRAEYLLSQTQQSIDDIALSLGFAEPTSFYRSFKQWTGETPSAWRGKRGK